MPLPGIEPGSQPARHPFLVELFASAKRSSAEPHLSPLDHRGMTLFLKGSIKNDVLGGFLNMLLQKLIKQRSHDPSHVQSFPFGVV